MQLTQRTQEALGFPGMTIGEPLEVETRIAEVAMRPGDLAIRGSLASSDGKGCKKLVAPVAADPDGFITNIASSTGIQVLTTFNGALGHGPLVPTANVVLVLSSHANWDATTAVVAGEDPEGNYQTENLAIPDVGGVTVTGVKLFSRVDSITIPAQSGTAGTATFGTGSVLGEIPSAAIVGLLLRKWGVEPASASAEYAQYQPVPVARKVKMIVEVESATAVVDGARVYARLTATGGEVVGAYRGDSDSGDAFMIVGLRFVGNAQTRDSVITAVIECNLPSA